MLLQIVGPVVGDYVYAMGEEGFKVTQESPIEDGKVTIDWQFTLDPNNSKDSYEYNSNFTLKEGKEPQALIGEDENGNEVEIGRYRISEDGKITVDIHEELYEVFEEVVGPEIEETLPLTPLVPAEPIEQEETKTDSEDNSNQAPQEGTEEETTTETEKEQIEGNNEKSTELEEPNEIIGRTVRMVASISDIDGVISQDEVNEGVKPFKFRGRFDVEGVVEKEDKSLFARPTLFSVGGKDLGNIFTFIDMKKGGNVINENDPVDVTDGATITLDYIWDTVGLNVNPGDWAETEIPDAFKLDTDFTDKDIITSGVNVGKYSIINNKLKFVFGDGITKTGEISNGTLGFGIQFNKEKFNKDIVQEIKFKGKQEKTFKVTAAYTGTISGIAKSGIATTDGNKVTKDAKEITWTIDIMNPGTTEMTNAKLGDDIPSGLTLDPTSIVITDLTVGLDATVYEGGISSISASSFPIDLGEINKYKGYRVKYKTTIDNYALKEFTNNAKLSYDENIDGLPAGVTVDKIERSNPIEKTGERSGEHKINWQIDINKAGGKVGQAIINDTLPAGAILDTTSIKVYKLTGSGGSWSETLDSSKSFNSFPIDLGKLESEDAYRIKYTTNIDYSLVNYSEYLKENNFENNVSLHDGTDEMGSDKANVKITRSDLLTKTGAHNVNYTDKKLNWTVTVNQAKHPITNAVLTDQLPAGLKISESDIMITRKGTGGETDSTNHTVTLSPTDGDGTTATDITINFDGTIKGTYEIKYSTTITDFTKGSFVNIASFNGTGIGPGVTVDPVTVNVPNNSYTKSASGINHTDKTMSWTIEVNPTREAIKELTITDTFPDKGLILLESTLKVNLGEVGELVKDTDYTLVANGAGYQEGFIIELKGDKLPINNKLTITYDTSYDTEVYPQIIKNTGSGTYKNNAAFVGITSNGHNISLNDHDSQSLVEASWNTGKKEGKLKSVDSEGKLKDGWISGNTRKIQWEVYINYQKHNIGTNVKVSDTLSYDGKVDMDSIEVREYDVAGNGDTNITGDAIGVAGNYSVTAVGDDKGFELTFTSEVTKRYVVVFTTSVPDISEEAYSNTAKVKGDTFTEISYSTSVGFIPYNKILSKETIGVKNNKVYTDDEVKWKVRINDALSTVTENVTVVDKISPGLIFNKDSVKVYKLRKSDGTDRVLVDKSEYIETFENNERELKIVFNGSIDSTYEIEYSTIVTATTGEISNSVEYSGGNLEKKSVPAIKYSAEQFSYVGGDPAKGAIKITKKDGSKLLAGAEFEIWYHLNGEDRQFTDKDKPKFVTDSNGELTIVNLPLRREYTIKEVKAPKGYVKKENPVATIKVENSAKSDKRDAYLLTVENEKIKGNIEFTKVNESDEPLVGIEFTLYKGGTEVTTAESDSTGLVTFKDVEYGDYTIKETKTLDGYILFSETLNASIGDDDNGKIVKPTKDSETIEKVINIVKKGNLEIKKTDENKQPLKDAKFKLYKQDSEGNLGDVVKVGGVDVVATSDDDGTVSFTNLPYGDYIIKEFSAPDSYAPLTDEIKLSIKDNGTTVKPSKGDLGSEINPVKNTKVIGDIEVKKLDEDGETGLAGAIFVLEQDGDVKYTSDATDEFGSYVFKNIEYGKYTLREQTPPIGYNPTTQREEVEIKEKDQELIIKKFINTKIRGNIKLKKVGESAEGLENAEFSIYKSTDTEFKVPISTATSNEDGEVLFENVAYGEYKIKETKAPEGYNLSDKVLEAKITKQDEVVDLTTNPVSNTKIRGNIEILKRNRNTHNPLKGATIGLYSVIDVLMDEKTTEDDGLVRFENLEYGRYYFRENKAPAGYILDNTKYYFDIEEDNVTLERNLDNTRRYYPPGPGPDPTYPPTGPERPTDPKPPVNPPTDPTKPVDPVEPTDPEEPVEIQEVPKEPKDPIKEETPKDTPKEGEIEVPEDSEPKITTPPTNGTVTIDPDGKWTYTPNPGFVGKDSFTITITHPDGTEEEIFVEIDVDEPPLGNIEAGGSTPEQPLKTLPKTGSIGRLGFYISGLLFIILGIFIVRRKTE
jgi:uncharacterized repeat protein (TIGR01451 family)/LPXTG-motif cell wall-anchored protein